MNIRILCVILLVFVSCGKNPTKNSNENNQTPNQNQTDPMDVGGGIDIDNDGIADGTLIDTDGDGKSDAIDLDGDGLPNMLLVDTAGNGTYDAVDTDGDLIADAFLLGPNENGLFFLATDQAGSNPINLLDDDGDGYTDGLDTDGDGIADLDVSSNIDVVTTDENNGNDDTDDTETPDSEGDIYGKVDCESDGHFVDAATGIDSGTTSTTGAPFASIRYAIDNATPGQAICVQTRAGVASYDESVSSLDIDIPIKLLGGFDNTWQRDSEDNRTIVDVASTGIVFEDVDSSAMLSGFVLNQVDSTDEGDSFIIKAESGIATLSIQNNKLLGGDNLGTDSASNYGIYVQGLNVEIVSNIIITGDAAAGDNQNQATIGATGDDGATGGVGDCNAAVPAIGGAGGGTAGELGSGAKGGNGGLMGDNPGIVGDDSPDGIGGGTAGTGGDPGGDGGPGDPGGPGVVGPISATIGASFGTLSGMFYVPALAGAGDTGGRGEGGGGGGGGGGQGCFWCDNGTGNAGGGGGQGGAGGEGGASGPGGGAAFAIFLYNAPTANIEDNAITVGNGGPGGAGGQGGEGGPGGASLGGATTCTGEVGEGGDGGPGGQGGAGGDGNGGGGGPSVGLFYYSDSDLVPIILNTGIEVGVAGSGGNTNDALAGNGGLASGIYDGDGGNTADTTDMSITIGTGGSPGVAIGSGADGVSGGNTESNW